MTLQPTRFKCYNWHNLLDKDISLSKGDVLSLGPSGSGKTTFIDTFNLIIAGNHPTIEWNGAADPTTAKAELKRDRNLRNILLRTNDGKNLAPVGPCLGYAALEFLDVEKKETIVMGLGAKVPSHTNVQVQTWWFFRVGATLDDFRFVESNAEARGGDEELRCLEPDEFEAANGEKLQVGVYRQKVMQYLFPGLQNAKSDVITEHLEKWIRMLNMSKAYGRLKDVNSLFRFSLPETNPDTFLEAKAGIDEINQARNEFDRLTNRREQLNALQDHLSQAREAHLKLIVTDVAKMRIKAGDLQKTQAELVEQLAKDAKEITDLTKRIEALRAEMKELDNEDQTLAQGDGAQILDKRKSLKGEIGELNDTAREETEALEDIQSRLSEHIAASTRQEEQLAERRGQCYSELTTLKCREKAMLKHLSSICRAIKDGSESDLSYAGDRWTQEAHSKQKAIEVQMHDVRATIRELESRIAELDNEIERLQGKDSLEPIEGIHRAIEVVSKPPKDAVEMLLWDASA